MNLLIDSLRIQRKGAKKQGFFRMGRIQDKGERIRAKGENRGREKFHLLKTFAFIPSPLS
jgi:hypothetical protein